MLVLTLGAAHAEECEPDVTAVTSIGRVVYDGSTVAPGRMLRLDFAEPDQRLRYVRLLLRPSPPTGSSWQLIVRDARLRIIDMLLHDHEPGALGFWTRRLYGSGPLYLDLAAESSQTRISVVRAIVMPEEAQHPYYSIQTPGVYAYSPLYEAPTETRRLGDHVGFLIASWGTKSWCCSGVAVGEDLFLTNWHCGGDNLAMQPHGFWSQQVCESTFVDFSWDGDGVDREFTCVAVLDKDETNDYALLRLRPLRGTDRLRAPALRRQAPRADESLQIVHHPACQLKQISRACTVRDPKVEGWRSGAGDDFTYPCDTERGSSGAPVFDQSNRLLGIHHLGFQKKGDRCDMLNKAVGLQGVLGAMRQEYADRLRALMRD